MNTQPKMKKRLPKELWKFTNTDTAIKIIATGEIWFQCPSAFNDLDELGDTATQEHPLLEAHRRVSGKTKEDSNLRICCFARSTKQLNLPYMWGAYGDCHKGIKLVFDTKKLIENLGKVMRAIESENRNIGIDLFLKENLTPIKYVKDPRGAKFGEKSLAWKAEQESRIAICTEGAILQCDNTGNPCGVENHTLPNPFHFNVIDCLTKVVVGHRADPIQKAILRSVVLGKFHRLNRELPEKLESYPDFTTGKLKESSKVW